MRKGERTRAAILDEALALASVEGLGGLTIGNLADRTGLSKSGLFAHFGSKEQLQAAVLERAAELYTDRVFRPAMELPRGLARLRAFFENWLEWGRDGTGPGGCPLQAAAAELDDKPGPLRDFVVGTYGRLQAALDRTIRQAMAEGELRADLDVDQFVFELVALYNGFGHSHRLMRHPGSITMARNALERLIRDARPAGWTADHQS